MITSIIFKSKYGTVQTIPNGSEDSNSFVSLDLLCSSSLLVLSLYPVVLSLSSPVLLRRPTTIDIAKQTKAVMTINDIEPFLWNGNFNLYGSLCTSVTDYTDTTDPNAMPRSLNLLVIFDGCYPCPVCKEIAWLQNLILNCQIWMQGMKDVNLYYLLDANSLWINRYNNKISNNNPSSCFSKPTSIQMDRNVIFGKAIKLLYQYKQVVAMWNFLVRTKKAHVQIIQAPLDFSGFIVQTKISVDTCGLQNFPQTARLNITAILQSGQCGSYLTENKFGVGFYIGATNENTYILYGKDSGIHGLQSGNNVQLLLPTLRLVEDTILIAAVFLFKLTTKAPTILSAALKILPVVYLKGHSYDVYNEQGLVTSTFKMPLETTTLLLNKLGLKTWIKYRAEATTIALPLQSELNRWCVLVNWEKEATDLLPQTLYYSTAYGKYPELMSDSGPELLQLE